MNTPTLRTRDVPILPIALAGLSALAAGTALWVSRKARTAEQEHPPIGKLIDVDGVRLHYVERGEGPPVVLLHGNTVLLQDFIASGLIDKLAERHRVIAFDRPGYGSSDRPHDRRWTAPAQAALIARALTQLNVEAPVVLGHSWGTLVAMALALDFPRQVSGLVLLSGYYYPTARLDVALTAPVAVPVLGDVMRYTVSPVFGRMSLKGVAKAMFSPCDVPAAFFDVLSREMMLRPSQLGANAQDAVYMVPAAAQFAKCYGELRMPVTIIAGAKDRIVDPEAHSVRLHDAIAGSELHIVPEVGHMVHYAVPDQVVSAVEALTEKPKLEASASPAANQSTSHSEEQPGPVPA